MLVSQAKFADFVGKSTTAVSDWLRDGMPHQVSGEGKARRIQIDSIRGVEWLVERARKQSQTSLDGETQRLRAAQADVAEMEAKKMLGELVGRNDVETVARACCTVINAELDAVPGRCAGPLAGMNDPGEVRQFVHVEMRRCRESISSEFSKLAGLFARGGDEAAAEQDAGPVGGPVPGSSAGEP